MEPFVKLTGIVAPLDRVDVDTDSIMPAQFLKRVERTGFGQYLFYTWRFLAEGKPDPEFILNEPRYHDASILVTGRNFGTGSSREHAPWALLDYGFRVIIAPSFADIFQKNCFENGIVPVTLPQQKIDLIMHKASTESGFRLAVDLEHCLITDVKDEEISISFIIHQDKNTHDFRRQNLLKGLDEIDLVLENEEHILAFEGVRGRYGGVLRDLP